MRLDRAALAALPRHEITGSDHGTDARWDGARLVDILHTAGAPSGDALRGKALSLYVRVRAADGYQAVFTLAELDPALGNADVIVADRRDGQALDAKEGPLRIVAGGEKRPARWVRQVIAIDVLRAPDTR